MPRCQVSLHQDNNGKRKGCDRDIVFPILLLKDQPDQLHAEGNPEEHIELDKTLEDLEVRIHLLNLTVCTKKLVDLPTELGVDLPT